MLVIIVIIALLAVLSTVGFSRAQESARSADCTANLHSMGGALMLYVSDHDGHLIPGAIMDDGGFWYNYLEPYMGTYGLDWFSPNRPQWQLCPSKIITPMTYETVGYGWNMGQFGETSAMAGLGWNSLLSQVTKPFHTIIIGDSKDANFMPGPSYNYQNRYLYSQPAGYLASRHNGAGNYLFLDWHVEPLTPTQLAADPFLWRKIQ